MTLARRTAAEAAGTARLLAAAVGSGVMGERLAAGNVAVALLAHTLATGAVLVALILKFGPISGAHFNPAVTLAAAWERGLPWAEAPHYVAAQLVGAVSASRRCATRWCCRVSGRERSRRQGNDERGTADWRRSRHRNG